VSKVLIQEAASWRLDEIYRYTRDRWGTDQAGHYLTGLFEAFDGIVTLLHERMHQLDCFRDDFGS